LAELKSSWSRARYRSYGSYEDEKALLLFYRDREVELRNAVQAATWSTMRALPGVTNALLFHSPYHSRLVSMMNIRETGLAFQRQGGGLLARAANAEAQRRILLAAIALERFRGKHGAYPQTLAELAPEFLKSAPVDFMDGQPLRYRLDGSGHFLLYSVGTDCVDNGGKIQKGMGELGFERPAFPGAPLPESDIVWPLPSSVEAVQALHKQEEDEKMLQQQRQEEVRAEHEWEQSPSRRGRVERILATPWGPDARDMTFQGRLLRDYLRNEKINGTNRLTLAELLTPKQIFTGGEPEDLTFEVPASFEAVTNMCELVLMVDADPEDPETDDTGGKQQEFERAPNGTCRLIWHTIYDPAARHAIQIQLTAGTESGGMFCGKGPAIAVTTTNLCQFSLDSATYEVERGARFHARLPESNGQYSIECLTTNGAHLVTLAGSTSNGEFNVVWNLVDDHGHRLNGETFNSIVHISFPDSGRTQTLKGP
jgi:hypothetical protein